MSRMWFHIFSIIILNSCGSGSVNEGKEIISSKEIPFSRNIAVRDTNSFEELSVLISYYRKKLNEAELKRIKAKKEIEYPIQISNDSLHQIDSVYYTLVQERSKSIYQLFVNKGASVDNFDALKYLIVDRTFPTGLIDSIFLLFPVKIRQSADGNWIAKTLKKRKNAEYLTSFKPSVLALPFFNINEQKVYLNDINSPYILLDFWASWCSPCRYENRNLKKLKTEIERVKNITIVAVSLDSEKGKWVKASNVDSLNYLNICDFKAFNSPLVKEFNITGIPYNVIINQKGDVLATNLWGDRLIKFINVELK